MPKCAFCLREAKLSGEHIWSDWICELFPEIRVIFRNWMAGDAEVREWEATSLDQRAKVVCKPCNEGWMSNLESQHAKPAMGGMILFPTPTALSTENLVSITLFAFKTAVIGDHVQRNKLPFFPVSTRYEFAETLRLPLGFHVWIGCIDETDPYHGVFRRRYWKTPPKIANGFKLYVCTWGIGRFLLQAATIFPSDDAINSELVFHLMQHQKWDSFSIPIWPMLNGPIIAKWPPAGHLGHNLLDEFCDRGLNMQFGTLEFIEVI